jgi:hypothetical protein
MKSMGQEKPWIIEFTKSWIPPGWPWNPNPAVSQPEEFYLLFGLSGMCILMSLIGIYAAILDLFDRSFWWNGLKIVLTALLFQWFSRGYFPFQIKITLICLLPFLLLWLASSSLSPKSHGNPTG